MRSVKHGLALAVCLAAALATGIANGQPVKPGSSRDKSNSQFQLRHDEPGGADGVLARQRARAGDCAGALPSFDAAIKITIDPTLRRDRGLCFEQVGDPFPAMEDYRFYLTARPEAPDADQIRDRLIRLEEQTKSEREQVGATGKLEFGSGSESYGGQAHYATGVDPGAQPVRKENVGPKQGEQPRSYDYYVAKEKELDAADASPLRYGTGPVVGVFVHIPRFFLGSGATGDFGYGIGAALRYSTSKSLTLAGEIGFAGAGTAGADSSTGGPLFYFGPELRVPLSPLATDQFVIGGGIGYERPVVSGTRVASDIFLARIRGGFRHIFGPTVGFEILVDGGPAFISPHGGGDFRTNVLIGGSFALVIGF